MGTIVVLCGPLNDYAHSNSPSGVSSGNLVVQCFENFTPPRRLAPRLGPSRGSEQRLTTQCSRTNSSWVARGVIIRLFDVTPPEDLPLDEVRLQLNLTAIGDGVCLDNLV
jgi:hypothetical protein